MQAIEFIFSSPFVFLGILILIGAVCEGIAEIIKAIRK